MPSAARMRMFGRSVRASLWLVPLLCLLAGVGLSLATIAIDRSSTDLVGKSITGTPGDAQQVLALIGEASVTLATLVLSFTLLAVQLAMGQFSPRIVRALLADRRSQLTVGLFLATFAFAMLALREIDDESGTVPGLTVLVAYVLALASLAALVLYVHYAGQTLRVSGLIDLVGDDLNKQLERRYAAPEASFDGDGRIVVAPDSGVVLSVEYGHVVAAAGRADCTLEMVPTMGDFVPVGSALFRVRDGDPTRLDREGVAELVRLGPERTHGDDPNFGFRKLVDIAERSIADPFDDPTTAVQAIDRLHDSLRQLAGQRFPSGHHRDSDGRTRLIVRHPSWDGYVRLAFDEIRLAGAGSPQVARRLRAALEDLKTLAPPERQPALDRQLELLTAAVRRSYEDEADVEAALVADMQGIGSGEDVLAGATDTTVSDRA